VYTYLYVSPYKYDLQYDLWSSKSPHYHPEKSTDTHHRYYLIFLYYTHTYTHTHHATIQGQMLSSATLARQWLLDMGAGAARHGLTVQYCMPFVRHLLQSAEVAQATQARASDDYVVGPTDDTEHPNWKIGGQSMLLGALGLAPSKVTYL
jgi:hypothetical protein